MLVHAEEAKSVLFISFSYDREKSRWNDPKETEVDYDRSKYHKIQYKEKLIEKFKKSCDKE